MDMYKTKLYKYIKGGMVKEKPAHLTIKSVEASEMPNTTTGEVETKYLLTFEESNKPLILNQTNVNKLIELFGRHSEDWTGKMIELYSERVKAFGKQFDVVRVRESKVQKQTDRLKSETLTPDERKQRRAENGSVLHAADESGGIGESDKERFARRVMAEIPFYTSQAQVFMALLGKSLDFSPEIEELCFDTLATEAQRLADAESAKA